MNDAVIMIIADSAKRAAEGYLGFEEIAGAVFREARKAWLTTDEEMHFKGGIAALLVLYRDDEEMTERLHKELQSLQNLSAAMSGVPVNFDHIIESDFEPLGLMKLWGDSGQPAKENGDET